MLRESDDELSLVRTQDKIDSQPSGQVGFQVPCYGGQAVLPGPPAARGVYSWLPAANLASWNFRFLGASEAADIACSRIRPCHSAGTSPIAFVESVCAIWTKHQLAIAIFDSLCIPECMNKRTFARTYVDVIRHLLHILRF